jgi:hypothetical protein
LIISSIPLKIKELSRKVVKTKELGAEIAELAALAGLGGFFAAQLDF